MTNDTLRTWKSTTDPMPSIYDVVDKDGLRWHRTIGLMSWDCPIQGHTGLSWEELLIQYGPVTEYKE